MATIKDHPRSLYVAIRDAWTGPVASRVGINNPDAVTTRWEWDVNLTAPQAAQFDDLVAAVKIGIDTTRYATVKADFVTMRAYLNIAAPTLVETAAATKSLIRALLRD